MNRNNQQNAVPWSFGEGTVIGRDRTIIDNGNANGTAGSNGMQNGTDIRNSMQNGINTRNGMQNGESGSITLSQEDLLDRIRALSFAVLETGLYLDCHPNHRTALSYYTKIKNELDAAVGEYEMTYGPLSQMSPGGNERQGWQWVKQPWPWEMGYPQISDRPELNRFSAVVPDNSMTMPGNTEQEWEG